MNWSELERFVGDVEADSALQRALKHCRSRKELILAARRLGYRITRIDAVCVAGGAARARAGSPWMPSARFTSSGAPLMSRAAWRDSHPAQQHRASSAVRLLLNLS
jgi:hypothetical protein